MIDQKFCEQLEYQISSLLSNTNHSVSKTFWCDGILLPISDVEISKKHVSNTRQIQDFTAFIGNDGKDKYSLTLKFGNKSLSRYARDLDIMECINDTIHLEIDIDAKTLILYLL